MDKHQCHLFQEEPPRTCVAGTRLGAQVRAQDALTMGDAHARPWSPGPGLSSSDGGPGERPLLKAVHTLWLPAGLGSPQSRVETNKVCKVRIYRGEKCHKLPRGELHVGCNGEGLRGAYMERVNSAQEIMRRMYRSLHTEHTHTGQRGERQCWHVGEATQGLVCRQIHKGSCTCAHMGSCTWILKTYGAFSQHPH